MASMKHALKVVTGRDDFQMHMHNVPSLLNVGEMAVSASIHFPSNKMVEMFEEAWHAGLVALTDAEGKHNVRLLVVNLDASRA